MRGQIGDTFHGVVWIAGKPTQTAPKGSRNRRILMGPQVISSAMYQLPHLPIWMKPDRTGHDHNYPVGIIEKAQLVGDMIYITGSLIAPIDIGDDTMGLSYDVESAYVANPQLPDMWTVEHCLFQGVTVLKQSLGAHRTDSLFWIEANHE